VELYERYENARETAADMGCSTETVYRALKKNGVKRTHRHDDETIAKVRVSHCNSKYCPALVVMLRKSLGYTASEIAEATGYKCQGVRNVLTKRGYPTDRECVHAEDFDLDVMEREYLGGASTYELGERYGVNHATISKWMRKRGVRKGKGNKSIKPTTKICPRCGKAFTTTCRNKKYCSKTCRSSISHAKRHDLIRAGNGDYMPLREVYERDSGRCYICGRKTDWSDYHFVNGQKVVGKRYPTREHVIALHNGGTHTWDNMRLACHECNSRKRDLGQMRMAI
jgi:transcriptional regulator with XRE-family HTH domain